MIADAATETNSTEPATPAVATAPAPVLTDLKLTAGVAQIVKLAQAGVGDDVMLAYINTMNAKFNLGSDQIIYLNDLGVSGAVIKAMIQRDGVLDAQSRAAVTAATQPTTQPNIPLPGEDGSLPPPPMDNPGAVYPPDAPDYSNVTPGDYAPADDSDYFYNSLAPYGSWVFVTGTGLCWQPTVCVANHDWRPYCDRGRWIYSDCGWYWQSDYSWGWGPFHYGRWFEDAKRGWVWQPDRVWGPAWVSWRRSADYCGWAPLPPGTRYVAGVGLQTGPRPIGTRYEFGLRSQLYTFIPLERMTDYTPGRYIVSDTKHAEVFSQSAVINKFAFENKKVVNRGLDPNDVAKASGTAVRHAQIHDLSPAASKGVQSDRLAKRGDALVIFRPQLPAPSAVRPVNATTVPKILSPQPSRTPGPVKNTQIESGSGKVQTATTRVPNLILNGAQNGNAQTETYPPDALVILARKNASQSQPAYSGPLPNMKLEKPAPETPFVYPDNSQPNSTVSSSVNPQPVWPAGPTGIPVTSKWNSRTPTDPAATQSPAAPETFNPIGNPTREPHNGWQSSKPFDDVTQVTARPASPARPVTSPKGADLIQQIRTSAESHPAPARSASQPAYESPRPVQVSAPPPVHQAPPPVSHVEAPHSSPPPAPAPAPAPASSSSGSSSSSRK